ncbi:hypothetical protein [Arthrobacter sp. NyZ413]|uniref:hypothetical protein n=1 Tax=Arthrobacter sp. NyZ413 TaxID=3144669 RepID=UPI003BF796AA
MTAYADGPLGGTPLTAANLNRDFNARPAKWAANTPYIGGTDIAISPSGDLVSCTVSHTSGTSYDAMKWKANAPYVDVDAQKLGSDPDDTLSWQRAVNIAIVSGVKRVLGKSPVYNCSAPINFVGATGLVIEGAGIAATVINASGSSTPMDALFYTSGAASDVIIQHMTIKGTTVDDVTAPRRSRTFTGPGLNSGVVAYGDFNPHNTGASAVRNIRLRHLRIQGTRGLPFQFDGVRGYAQAIDVETELTMDGGWVSCETVVFDQLRSYKSADNGFSISRDCKRVIGGSVYVELAAYYGLWLSGFIVNNDTTDLGPTNFIVDTVNVKNVGLGGLKLDDAPSNGRINNVLVDGVSRGTTDGPSPAGGIGVLIGGYPSTSRSAPTSFASQISIGSMLLMNCQRGGVLVTGATDIHLGDVQVINAGSQYKEDGTTVISSSDNTQNFGVSLDSANPGTVTRPFVRNLRVVDNRGTPYTNFPIYLTGAVSPGYANVSAVGARQTFFSDNITETFNGSKVFQLQVKDVGGATAGSSAATGTVLGYDFNGAAGSTRTHRIKTAAVDRWGFGGDGTSESGSNAGTDWVLNSYDDSGASLATLVRMTRLGAVTLGVTGKSITMNAKIVSASSSVTGITAGAQASSAAAGGNGANDIAGTLNATAVASPSAGTLVTVTFGTAYATTPHVVLTPQNAASASCQPYLTRSSTGFSIACATAPGASASLSFDYHVIG